ncbi:MAG: hypothetical protein DI582_01230 [Azospirillum brasilense]|nr:MAG: hypothetical protein DI582_01230 [Azospirillum brasilense]
MAIDPTRTLSAPAYGPTATENTLQPDSGAFAALLKEDSPEETLGKITHRGVQSLMEWKIEQLKKKITEEVMAAKGISEADLNAMPPEERAAALEMIMREVQEQLKQAMNEQMKREKKIDMGFAPGAKPFTDTVLDQLLAAQETADSASSA